MSEHLHYLLKLKEQAKKAHHRRVVVLDGSSAWQTNIILKYRQVIKSDRIFKLGGKRLESVEHLSYKQGQQLLGRELDILIYDDADGFDANSFAAATGAILGGGLLLLILSSDGITKHSWFRKAFGDFVKLSEHEGMRLPNNELLSDVYFGSDAFSDQQSAIQLIQNVIQGHRKRPLVITADRGRGKSAALGMAAARIMQASDKRILVTAPARKSVNPVFEHARKEIEEITSENKNYVETHKSSMQFISPDDLLQSKPKCDILFVDEASAIPIPILIDMVENYHRVVFSTTVHGYEGCGRGFTLKFAKWLDSNRPGWKSCHMSQPIRWAENDPLESWLFNTFLLDAEVAKSEINRLCPTPSVEVKAFSKDDFSADEARLRHCFALLVAAHYQTSPNDLLHLLESDSTYLFEVCFEEVVVGCVLLNIEGGMEDALISEIESGSRRPKGHLIPTTLCVQQGIKQAASLTCLRIMRIAIHPDLQGMGIGTRVLELIANTSTLAFDYVATSFGVTSELFRFWKRANFVPLRLGAKRDPASGTHSIIMARVNKTQTWIEKEHLRFKQNLLALLPEIFSNASQELLLKLLLGDKDTSTELYRGFNPKIIEGYGNGAVSYESAFLDIYHMLVHRITEQGMPVHPVVLSKYLQRNSWADIASRFSLSGRKQVETLLKQELVIYLNLQCKLTK